MDTLRASELLQDAGLDPAAVSTDSCTTVTTAFAVAGSSPASCSISEARNVSISAQLSANVSTESYLRRCAENCQQIARDKLLNLTCFSGVTP